jgi:hypothetical protein
VWLDVQKAIAPADTDIPLVANLKEHWREQFVPLEYAHVHHYSKALVTHVKNSSMNNALQSTLKQEFDVRWNTSLEMFESIYTNYDAVSSKKYRKF